MARGRMIDKRIAKSKKLAALKHDRSRVLYFMILPHLDVDGKFTGDPEEIKEDCCPKLKYSILKIAESIIELADFGLLKLYEVDGRPFIKYTKFNDFQFGIRKDKEAPSRIPDSVQTKDGPTPSLYLSLSLKLRKEGKGIETDYIDFDFQNRKWLNIKIEDKSGWLAAYPACDIDLELHKMREWLLANPLKKKSNYRRFIVNWLSKTQDQGGSEKQGRPRGRPMTRKEERQKKVNDWVKGKSEK